MIIKEKKVYYQQYNTESWNIFGVSIIISKIIFFFSFAHDKLNI